jgi:hypothetical protein
MLTLTICFTGCALTRGRTEVPPATDPWQDLAPSISVAAQPARRLLVTTDDNQSSSRVLALWLRVENGNGETVAFSPDNVALVFADGTVGTALDRARANALIERLDIAPTDEAVADYPDLWALAGRASQQPNLKRQLSDGLLEERLFAAGTVEGYVVFDTKRSTSSLDGASLRVTLVRDSDRAELRQLYRFAAPEP